MSTFKHVLNTWLLSHVFHPFLFCFYQLTIGESVPVSAFPLLLVIGPIISIPALLISWLFLYGLYSNSRCSIRAQAWWLLLVLIAIILNQFILSLLFGVPHFILGDLSFLLPAFISSWIAILIRTNQFQHLFTIQSIDNENSLV